VPAVTGTIDREGQQPVGGTLSIFETANGMTTAVYSITFGNGDYTTANFILTSDLSV
jgi:hypothetical protein